jgi:hypothetical protein
MKEHMNRPLGFADRVIDQWHPSKNSAALHSIKPGSHDKAWWLCEKGHEWEAQIRSRSGEKPTQCPVCTGKQLLAGFNDLATTHPELAEQWHPTRNDVLTSDQVFPSSRLKTWWLDEYGHEWEAVIRSRVEGANCPVCSGRILLSGFNDLATRYPELMKEWDRDKNHDINPSLVFSSNASTVSWKCEHGHVWDAKIQNRTAKSNGCPYCAKQRVDPKMGSIAVTHPQLAAWWDPKNNNISMESVSLYSRNLCHWVCPEGHQWQSTVRAVANKTQPCYMCKHDDSALPETLATEWNDNLNKGEEKSVLNSQRRVWWTSELCGHTWEAKITHRLSGSGCVYCSGYKVLPGFNDLTTTHPALVQQWHPTKNVLLPTEVTAGSKQRVWWLCKKGHEWETFVYARARTSHSSGCPSCNNIISQPETDLYDILKNLGLRIEKSNRTVLKNRMELDLYFPEKKFAIEFNGLYWHSEAQGKDKRYHYNKYEAANKAGIQLVQIWEDDWRDRKNVIIRALAHKLGVTNRLAEAYPELADVTTKIFARKTQIVQLNTDKAKEFLSGNHIQGYASGSYYVGLESSDGILRALMVLKKEADETLNIVRYATAGSVTGGFLKLLTHATRTYQPKTFITFADHAISDGGLYQNNGFVADKELPPDYMYVVNKERKHKFGYRLKKFRDDPALIWDENLSERELALLNNLPRIWDAGKTRYRLDILTKN